MAPFRSLAILSFCLALLAPTHPASAITADDVMKKMSDKERQGYLAGLIDMLAYQTAAAGNREKSSCIVDAFFDEKKNTESWSRLHAAFRQYADKRPEILLTAVAGQICK
jgi:hypothetical protein